MCFFVSNELLDLLFLTIALSIPFMLSFIPRTIYKSYLGREYAIALMKSSDLMHSNCNTIDAKCFSFQNVFDMDIIDILNQYLSIMEVNG